ncbi:CobW family GTP-binding protein [Clostridium grantii]|uniref:GTPase, G3E family n=1 Tax=Clostridium grantii DSM 8605 TaxID=1121316 RepID=A0A1M5SZK4_9CLOT|nr:GTP-binding protein [Clostridium grantii]SHH43780.1 GTPase, G3E family [Clostridium grantii DSM 8605]
MKTKVDIISGFLGVGKTMLIKKLIKDALGSEKIVIIENEFGEIGIDGNSFLENNVQVKEMTSGCICCSFKNNFKKALLEVIDVYNPDRIIIEPTGVAKLSDILKILENESIKDKITVNMILTVINPEKHGLYLNTFGNFYKNQIIYAKTLIFSRAQNFSKENLERFALSIKELNSKANLITSPWNHIEGDLILRMCENISEDLLFSNPRLSKSSKINSISTSKPIKASDIFDSLSIKTSKFFSEKYLEELFYGFNKENHCGFIIRAKGIVQVSENKWIQFDYVPGEFNIIDSTYFDTGKIVIIGENLNKNKLSELLAL